MAQFYTNPRREADPHALPDAEVFRIENDAPDDGLECGWYYWYCFPGCMPDSEPCGPFNSEQAAIDDARENAGEFDDED